MDAAIAHDPVKPRTIRRRNGEWLAVAPKNARFSIGVTAPTEKKRGKNSVACTASGYHYWNAKTLDVPK